MNGRGKSERGREKRREQAGGEEGAKAENREERERGCLCEVVGNAIR